MSANQTAILRDLLTASKDLAGRTLSAKQIEQLISYYALVLKWNRALNLTTITQPEEFKERHLDEACLVASYLLPSINEAWDLGSGLGIPGIPVAIGRPLLRIKLIEANSKKAIFLEEVAVELKLDNVRVANRRFEQLDASGSETALLARAVDKMEAMLPEIFRLGANAAQLLILCAEGLAKSIQPELSSKFELKIIPIPGSHQRRLVSARRFT